MLKSFVTTVTTSRKCPGGDAPSSLSRVHENGSGDGPIRDTRVSYQLEMAIVQMAHRRDETQRPGGCESSKRSKSARGPARAFRDASGVTATPPANQVLMNKITYVIAPAGNT